MGIAIPGNAVFLIETAPCVVLPISFSKEGIINSSPPRHNGCDFADDIFNCIVVNEKFCILIKISLKFVPRGLSDNNPALV